MGVKDTDRHDRPAEALSLACRNDASLSGRRERALDPSWGNQGRLPGGGDPQVIPESGVAWVQIGVGQGIQDKWLACKKGVSHPQPCA